MRLSFCSLILLCLAGCAAPGPSATVPDGQAGPLRPAVDASHSTADVQRFVRMGQDAAAKGKPDVAMMLFHSAAMADKDDPAPRLAAAEALEDDGQFDAAATIYESVLAQDKSRDPLLALAAGRMRLKQPDYAKASVDYQLLADSGDWRALEGLGIARAGLKDKAGSDAAFGTALAATGVNQARVRANWARADLARKDHDGAIALLEPGQQAGTASGEETQLLAIAYRTAGRTAEADQLAPATP